MFQIKVVEKIKTHISHSITFLRKSWSWWDNMEKYGTARQATDDNIKRRMRAASWITKAADIRNTYCFSMATMVTWTRLKITFIPTYIASLIALSCDQVGLTVLSKPECFSKGLWQRLFLYNNIIFDSDYCLMYIGNMWEYEYAFVLGLFYP